MRCAVQCVRPIVRSLLGLTVSQVFFLPRDARRESAVLPR